MFLSEFGLWLSIRVEQKMPVSGEHWPLHSAMVHSPDDAMAGYRTWGLVPIKKQKIILQLNICTIYCKIWKIQLCLAFSTCSRDKQFLSRSVPCAEKRYLVLSVYNNI